MSLSFDNARPSDSPHARSWRQLEPEVLLKAGILSDPRLPEQALRRARGLMRQGFFKEARGILQPHTGSQSAELRAKILEVLAHCAMNGAGGDWEALFKDALRNFERVGDRRAQARVQQRLGEMHLAIGQLVTADQHLKAAAATFAADHEMAGVATVDCLRARVRLRAGYLGRALRRIDRAIDQAILVALPRIEAMARLDRARIYALQGDHRRSAKDLVTAERFLASSGKRSDRLRSRLTRAEALLSLGDTRRAIKGLLLLLDEVAELEEVATRAMLYYLLGLAHMDRDASAARRYLTRSRHLYSSLRYTYHVTACDIALARSEFRIGLNPRGRLTALQPGAFAEWPLLLCELRLARVEILREREPQAAQEELRKAWQFASGVGNVSLLMRIRALSDGNAAFTMEEIETTSVEGLRPASSLQRAPTSSSSKLERLSDEISQGSSWLWRSLGLPATPDTPS